MAEWQEDATCIWFCDKKLKCDICGSKVDDIVQFKIDDNHDHVNACTFNGKPCVRTAMAILFAKKPEQGFLYSRGIKYKRIGGSCKKREPIGLSKRYEIMRRDGFQCVLCGSSGKEAKLEIDHIIPVSSGGPDTMENLRTLCFDCNRGKGSKIEA